MRYLLTFLTLLLISASAAAQDATPEGWEVVQRCITAPSEPPEGWTFEGTIFTYRGSVHGFRADLPSPYYIAFGSDTEFGGAGTFSPDGRWYALPRGRTRRTDTSFAIYRVIEEVRVISTIPDRTIVDIPWLRYEYTEHIALLTRPRWLTVETLEYTYWDNVESASYIISPFQNPILINEAPNPLPQFLISSSPDGSRGIYQVDSFQQPDPIILFDNDSNEEILDFADQDSFSLNTTSDFGVSLIGWFSDSSGFVASGRSGEQNQILIFDRNGVHLETPLSSAEGFMFRVAQNGMLAAYVPEQSRTLHVVNIATREIIDTCIQPTFREFAVSPNGDQVALGIRQDGFVYILDIEDWAAYRLDLAAADVIAWFPSA